ncbi:DUF1016 domain-containing protein [Pseudobutyrivibrio xylanivorans]|uniref:DUF1016 domain-containing protein n=1 Tax=Pseudobutyrivibrio xylanivorans TaxID=185007 RepID=A0A5P6VTZ7_PSEXY|nr:DUF1016 domain-containing protein [Pseudobutyrivibrio xylanivorans]
MLEDEIIFVIINLTELPGANNTWDQAERLAWLFYFKEIVPTVSAHLLSWSHYERFLQVDDKEAREWYAKEAYKKYSNDDIKRVRNNAGLKCLI